ncbi:MAG: Gfo/Idh/MocA family oxidoreductase [Verrucomicrobiales bacterium]|nr:Gfo/Idh/MocA family oxidoreductase [Verrucomicrobiales bacterium]
MKVALLGAGWFGREAHLRNLIRMSDVEIAAVSSRSDESLSASRELVGPELRCSKDWREIIAMAEIDAVIIALTNDQHHAAAIEALRAGKHVMCEKPLGLNLQQCDEIIELAESTGKVLQIGHEMRFQALYEQMKQRIDRGDIGDLQLMWCREFRGPMRPGWRSSEQFTGGTILEKNVHHIDLFNWMMDRPPVRVSAHGGTNVLTDREGLDNAQVLIEYEGGRRASLELCLFAPKGGDCEIGVCGDGGRIDTRNQALELTYHPFDEREREQLVIADEGDAANFTDSSGRVDRGIGPELVHFVDCIRSGKTPLNDGPSARLAVAVCLAAQESIKRRESVEMGEFA